MIIFGIEKKGGGGTKKKYIYKDNMDGSTTFISNKYGRKGFKRVNCT